MKTFVAKIVLICLLVISINGCEVGEFKASNGKCQQCDISCYTCTNDGCKTCYDQMFPTTRSNTIVCELCYNILNGCDICLMSTKCQNCSAGYYLQNDNTCSSCSTLFPNCLLCSYGNMTECLGCQAPYEPINGSCILTETQGRQSLSTKNNQQTATAQQQQTQSIPEPASISSIQPTSPINTINCDSNQILLSGKCYQSIAFCQTYNQKNGSCISCIQSFKQNNGYCLPQNLIPFFNDASGQAQDQGQGQKNNDNGLSSTCSLRQYGTDGNCFDIGPQCLEFDRSNGTCFSCASGFQPYNGLCIQLASNLQQQIVDQASHVSNNCGAILPHCVQVNPQNPSYCFICCDGYTVVDSIPGVCYSIN